MNRIFGLLLFSVVVVGVMPLARSLDAQSTPPNVKASEWVPIGDAAGFVITDDAFGNAPAPGSVKGYFVVHRSGAWLRVDSQPDLKTTAAAVDHARGCRGEGIAGYGQI
jgi:hypothetical protein